MHVVDPAQDIVPHLRRRAVLHKFAAVGMNLDGQAQVALRACNSAGSNSVICGQ